MATIRRHSVPADSYDPKRPLNDLMIAQFEHFKHIAERLPADVRSGLPPVPAQEDRAGVDRFIAALTAICVSRKRALPQLVRTIRDKRPGRLAVAAAVAEKTPAKTAAARQKSSPKRSSGGRRKR